jgi:protein subunit release factor B
MNFPIDLPDKFQIKSQDLNINPELIIEKYITGSGPGGQKINKTANAVFLKYEPLGISVKCQKHREREANRLSAYKLLINKIEDHIKGKESERAQKIFKLRKQKKRRSKKAKEKVLEYKKRRGELKKSRRSIDFP